MAVGCWCVWVQGRKQRKPQRVRARDARGKKSEKQQDMVGLVHGEQQRRSDMEAAVQSVKEGLSDGNRKGYSQGLLRCSRSCSNSTMAAET